MSGDGGVERKSRRVRRLSHLLLAFTRRTERSLEASVLRSTTSRLLGRRALHRVELGGKPSRVATRRAHLITQLESLASAVECLAAAAAAFASGARQAPRVAPPPPPPAVAMRQSAPPAPLS